jgi:beta-glucosidase
LPLYITENGAAFADVAHPGAEVVEDPQRVAYLREHLAELQRAIAGGADVRGYYVWTLTDNFEWHHGFSKRFGLIHVDFETQRRTWKRSAHFYRDVIAANGLPSQ